MVGTVTWEVLAGLAAILFGAFAIWWRIEGRIKEARQDAGKQADAASSQAIHTASQLAEYKTHVAETYVSKEGHKQSTDQIMTAIVSVKTAVEGTNQRIDRLFDGPPARRGRSQE